MVEVLAVEDAHRRLSSDALPVEFLLDYVQ